MSKSSKNTIDKRVKDVATMLLNGDSRDIILQNTSKYNISDRQIDSYIKKARLIIEKSVEKKY